MTTRLVGGNAAAPAFGRPVARAGRLALLAAVPVAVSACASAADDPGMYVAQVFAFIAFCFVLSTGFGWWFMRRVGVVPTRVRGGLPTQAVIQTIADTGRTVTSPWVGPDAPGYKLGLLVTPPGGGQPYPVEIKAFVPRVLIPTMVPGNQIGVIVDPGDRSNVKLDTGNSN